MSGRRGGRPFPGSNGRSPLTVPPPGTAVGPAPAAGPYLHGNRLPADCRRLGGPVLDVTAGTDGRLDVGLVVWAWLWVARLGWILV